MFVYFSVNLSQQLTCVEFETGMWLQVCNSSTPRFNGEGHQIKERPHSKLVRNPYACCVPQCFRIIGIHGTRKHASSLNAFGSSQYSQFHPKITPRQVKLRHHETNAQQVGWVLKRLDYRTEPCIAVKRKIPTGQATTQTLLQLEENEGGYIVR